MHAITLTDAEVLWLLGHTAYEDGVGRDIYDRLRRLPAERPKAQLPMDMSAFQRAMREATRR